MPPVPLDWCVAQTQATIGMLLIDALDAVFAHRGIARRAAAVVTRVRVDPDDPGFRAPTKPIGRYVSADELAARLGVSRMTVWRWSRDGHLPAPLALGPNRIAWRESEIVAWEAARERVVHGRRAVK